MKNIKLPIRGVIRPTPGSPVNLGIAKENLEAARENGKKVIMGALAIERQLEDIISLYLFLENKKKTKFFRSNILSSDWFTFSAKRKIVIAIINHENKNKKLLSGKNKSGIESNLSKIIKYRNTFAHGDIVEKSDGTFIEYFDGQLKDKRLIDEYWEQLEDIFSETFCQLNDIISSLSKA